MNAAAAPASIQKAAPERQHEPSMEEILASIRRIISEDQPISPRPLAPPAPVISARDEPVAPPSARDAEAAVDRLRRALEPAMDQSIVDRPPPPTPLFAERPSPAPSPAVAIPAPEPVAPAASPVVAEEPSAAPSPSRFPSLQRAFPAAAPMLERVASEAPVPPPPAPFAPIAESEPAELEPSAPAEPEPQGLLSPTADASIASSFQTLATTMFMQENGLIEEMAREMLRPMLKQWLDDNLPVMVEKLVRAEIERVARGPRLNGSH